MQQIMKDAKVTPANPVMYSYTLNTRGTRTTSIQMVAKPLTPIGPVRAIGWLEGSNDKTNWKPMARLIASGDGTRIDGGPIEALWEVMRFRLTTTDDCSVDVYLSQREG